MPQSIWTPLGQLAHMISSPELSIQLDAVHSLIPVLDPILRIRLQFRTFETCATVIQSLLLYLATHVVLARKWQLSNTDIKLLVASG